MPPNGLDIALKKLMGLGIYTNIGQYPGNMVGGDVPILKDNMQDGIRLRNLTWILWRVANESSFWNGTWRSWEALAVCGIHKTSLEFGPLLGAMASSLAIHRLGLV